MFPIIYCPYDYITVQQEYKAKVCNVKVIPNEECVPNHKLLVMDMQFNATKRRHKFEPRVHAWKKRTKTSEDYKNKLVDDLVRVPLLSKFRGLPFRSKGLHQNSVETLYASNVGHHYTNTHTHTTVLRLCGICPGKPG